MVNRTHATKKFAVTHHSRMIIFFQNFADMKLSGALNSSVFFGSSHFKLQNHPRGIAFAVYSVHFLSFQSLQILGGIQIPNSSTFTPDFLAAVKCQSSWSITSIININIQAIIAMATILYFLSKLKNQFLNYKEIYRKNKQTCKS